MGMISSAWANAMGVATTATAGRPCGRGACACSNLIHADPCGRDPLLQRAEAIRRTCRQLSSAIAGGVLSDRDHDAMAAEAGRGLRGGFPMPAIGLAFVT